MPKKYFAAARDGLANSNVVRKKPGAVWSYDDVEKILFVAHPEPVELSTRSDILAYFDEGIAFWRRHCNGQRAFVVVDYANLTSNLAEIEFYASQIKRVIDECAITVVRYNGNMLQRTAGRMIAIKLHTPSHTYASRDEALAVVRGVKRGAIQTMPPP